MTGAHSGAPGGPHVAASSSSSAPPAANASSSSSGGILTLLLHHAVFRDDVAELERLIATGKYDINSVDAHGNTALHIAVQLSRARCVPLLVSGGSKVAIKNRSGWTAIHEATSVGDRETLRILWTAYKTRARDVQSLSGFMTHFSGVADFRIRFEWKIHSWVPFIRRFLPTDSFTISKRGADIRIDTNMLEFKGLSWVYHPYSFLIKPRPEVDASVEGATPAGPDREPFLVYTIDHEEREWQCVSGDDDEGEAAAKKESSKVGSSASASSSPATAATAAPASAPATDEDLQYELDDFQSAPITSTFSPGRLTFRAVRPSLLSWRGWSTLLGFGAPSQKVERIHSWAASVWRVENIRLHTHRRYEHLSEGEVAAIRERDGAVTEMLAKPDALQEHLEADDSDEDEDDDEEQEEQQEEGKEGEAEESQQEGAGESIADLHTKAASRHPRPSKKKKAVHRPSLPPPPPCGVSFDEYFHAGNHIAYSFVEKQQAFGAARDAALLDGEAQVVEEEEVDLAISPDAKESEQEEVGGEVHRPRSVSSLASNNALYAPLLDADAPPYLHLGRAIVEQVTRKKYSARLWMADQFPLSMMTVLHVVDLLFGTSVPQLVAKFRHFVTAELPAGFPVRITAPIISIISGDIAIASYEEGPHVAADFGPNFFDVPADYKREEKTEEEQHKRHHRFRKRWKPTEPKQRNEGQQAQ